MLTVPALRTMLHDSCICIHFMIYVCVNVYHVCVWEAARICMPTFGMQVLQEPSPTMHALHPSVAKPPGCQ